MKSLTHFLFCIAVFMLSLTNCEQAGTTARQATPLHKGSKDVSPRHITQFDSTFKTIHVFVALCDNKYQGIVPVPPKLGNGQDPATNLYWGAGYGIKTHFVKSKEWKLLSVRKKDNMLLERLIFKHTSKNYYLVADAYNGKFIKDCTRNFFYSCSGQEKDTLKINGTTIGSCGNASLVAYIGHDGLMEFSLDETFANTDNKKRDCIILACSSQTFFSAYLDAGKTNPLVWTTNLMCPEAYTIHDALTGYVNQENNEQIRTRAAKAYAKYQKCGEKFARNLLATGW